MSVTTPKGPTPEQLKELRRFVEGGMPLRLAANAIEVTEETLRCWMKEDPKLEILVGGWEANFQRACIELILSARDRKGNANVRALMWLLESRFPEGKKKATSSKSAARTPKPETPEPGQVEPGSTSGNVSSALAPENASEGVSSIAVGDTEALAKPTVVQFPKTGRNEPCPCGSGHKYKHCCGATNPRARRIGLRASLAQEPIAA